MEDFAFKWEHIMFDVRIAVDQTTEEKANKNAETPTGTNVYSPKSGAVV